MPANQNIDIPLKTILSDRGGTPHLLPMQAGGMVPLRKNNEGLILPASQILCAYPCLQQPIPQKIPPNPPE
jgi:hypothetical protein